MTKMTIGKKLIISFLGLGFLVLLAGTVGIVVLKMVAHSGNVVAMEKAPTQHALMSAALSLCETEASVERYQKAEKDLADIEHALNRHREDFAMWISLIKQGTTSSAFTDSPAGARYRDQGLQTSLPESKGELLTTTNNILEKHQKFSASAAILIAAHKEYVNYSIPVDGGFQPLPAFLNLAQRLHLDWLKQLKDAIDMGTPFTGETDPKKGVFGQWLYSYQVPDQGIMKLVDNIRNQHEKLLQLVAEVNAAKGIEEQQKIFNKGIANAAKIEMSFSSLHNLSAKIYKRLEGQQLAEQKALTAIADDIDKDLTAMIKAADSDMGEALTQSHSASKSGITLLVILTISAVIVAIGLGLLMSRYISRNIHLVVMALKQIAQGDLRTNLVVSSQDEFGDLAQDTNTMVAQLQSMIGKVLNSSKMLSEAAHDLTSVSTSLEKDSEDLNTKATGSSDAITILNGSMNEISTVANDSKDQTQSVSHAIQEMNATISEIAESTGRAQSITTEAVSTVKNTSEDMKELGKAAHEIGQVVEVIVAIAKQTNLLALNATIEAARAGEAGKGFAVVANEVKELAKQTNDATGNIRSQIEAIQQTSDKSIGEIQLISSVMDNINAIVVNIAGAVEEQTATSHDIAGNINNVAIGIKEMTENLNSATAVTNKVAEDVLQVNATSKSVKQGSSHIQESAARLASLADDLHGLVGQFRI
jgi:methyl-accepting chemotaxis protein